jgi:hypothetical protein
MKHGYILEYRDGIEFLAAYVYLDLGTYEFANVELYKSLNFIFLSKNISLVYAKVKDSFLFLLYLHKNDHCKRSYSPKLSERHDKI